MQEFITRTEKIPFCRNYDIIVSGGGVAGIAAALAAAREDKKVLLIEKNCILGGLATSGLFFAFGSEPIRQIVVSTSGRYSSRKIVPGQADQWEKIEGLTISNRIWPKQRRLEINLPLTPEMTKNFRFNLVRARKLTDKRKENSTWSPAAKIGNWSNPEAYGAMLIK